jgi:hypothetical protein
MHPDMVKQAEAALERSMAIQVKVMEAQTIQQQRSRE